MSYPQQLATNRIVLFIFVAFLQQKNFVYINKTFFFCKKNNINFICMKKNIFLIGVFMCALFFCQSVVNAQSFRVTSDGKVQIGYDLYSSLSFGK